MDFKSGLREKPELIKVYERFPAASGALDFPIMRPASLVSLGLRLSDTPAVKFADAAQTPRRFFELIDAATV